ncbi:MAG: tail fiber protein [Tagaea sp.]|nr:tail fiber protein [Tagaea sp.]
MDMTMAMIFMWPVQWAPEQTSFCQGQQLSTQQNAALFSLIGTIYGGNGNPNFLLPNLSTRVPIGTGNGNAPLNQVTLGQTFGSAAFQLNLTSNGILNSNNLPGHTHPASFTATTGNVPVNISVAGNQSVNIPVGVSVPSSITPNPLSGPQYLNNYQAGIQPSKGGFVSSQPVSPVNLAGVNLTGSPGVTASPTVNVVTGGSVAVQSQNQSATQPFQTVGQGTVNVLQPSFGMGFLIATNGLYPVRPN